MNTNLKAIPLADWKLYLRWHLINTFAPYLSFLFVNENFRMTAAITGAKKLAPLWLRVVIAEDHELGDAVGKLYVEKNFTSASKTAIEVMVNNMKLVMQNNLHHISWLTPATRAAALKNWHPWNRA
jgi:putative endopeptidase